MNSIDKNIIKILLFLCRILSTYSNKVYEHQIKELINELEVK